MDDCTPVLTQTALLIGGPADGRRIQVLPEMSYYETVITTPPASICHRKDIVLPTFEVVPRHVYTRVTVLVRGVSEYRSENAIFIHSSIDPVSFDIYRCLFDGYRSEATPK